VSLLGRVRYPSPYRELAARGRIPVERVVYGRDPDQRVELRRPAGGAAARGVAVLVHGGFWRDVWRCDLMNALAIDLATRGWAAWNIEYRRVTRRGDAWPDLLEDAAAGMLALDGATSLAGLPVVLVGHSAGGQLALWLAARLTRGAGGRPATEAAPPPSGRGEPPRRRVNGVVGLAAVSDLRAAARQHLGGDAVADLLGAMPEEVPERAAEADPAALLPIGAPLLLVHGGDDEAVPAAMSRDFATAARAAGDTVEVLELAGVGHSALVDPAQPFWEPIRAWMDERAS
jgi:acetyl esterase/lipase